MWKTVVRLQLLALLVALVAFGSSVPGGVTTKVSADALNAAPQSNTLVRSVSAAVVPLALTNTSTETSTATATASPSATTTATPSTSATATTTSSPSATITTTPSATGTPTTTPSPSLTVPASSTFTSTPVISAISVSPSSGAPGSLFTLTGSGFNIYTALTVTIGGVTVGLASGGAIQSDGSGNVSAAISVPTSLLSGVATVTATDSTHSATTSYTVVTAATITALPTSGIAGSLVTLTGGGFTANVTLNVTVGGIAINSYSGGSVTSDGSGNFSTTIAIPSTLGAGYNNIIVTDGAHSATLSFLVTGSTTGGSLVAAPNGGAPGISVALTSPSGSFPANASATVTFLAAGTSAATTLGASVTNSDGSFNQTFSLPTQAPAGAGTISVVAGGVTQSTTFTVQPVLVVSPTSALPGTTLQVSGNGFAVNSSITIQVAGQTVSTAVANTLGNFTATLTLPTTIAAGSETVTATDTIHVATSVIQVLLAATATPSPTYTFTSTVIPSPTPSFTNTPVTIPTLPFVPFVAPPTSTPVIASATPTPKPTAKAPSATHNSGVATSVTYFAEGNTGRAVAKGAAQFTETLNLLNPSSKSVAVTLTYIIQGKSGTLTVHRTIAPTTVLREQVNKDVGANTIVAAVVNAPTSVVVTRTVLRNSASGAVLGGSTSQGIHAPSTTWYFADGSTGGDFQEYLSLLNAGHTAARVTIRLAPQASTAAGVRTRTVVVPALSHATVDISSLSASTKVQAVGLIVTSDKPVVAEAVEYFGTGVPLGRFGMAIIAGATTPAKQFHVPFGRAGGVVTGAKSAKQPQGDQAAISLLNPSLSGNPVQVSAVFADSQGHHLATVTVKVAAGVRQTLSANTILGKAIGPFSVTVTASGPIVAAEAQYFGGSPTTGSHPEVVVPTVTTGGATVFLANLDTQLVDRTLVQRLVYLFNPGKAPIQIKATYFDAQGHSVSRSYTVPAGGIATVNVNHDSSALAAGAIGASFTVSGPGEHVVAYAIGCTADNRTTL